MVAADCTVAVNAFLVAILGGGSIEITPQCGA